MRASVQDVALFPSRRAIRPPVSPSHPAIASDPARSIPSVGTGGNDPAASAIEMLHEKTLRVPIDGADVARWRGQFGDPRDQGGRAHEAVDILAPRNTPIHAVEDGTIAELFFSKGRGGNTIYQFDPLGTYLLLLRPPRAIRGGLAEAARQRGRRDRLRRHFRQCRPRTHLTCISRSSD